MAQIAFNTEALATSERDYEKVQYKDDQRTIIEALAKLICSKISMSELAMRGFMSKSIKNWQIRTKKEIADVIGMNPADRVKHVGDMFQELKLTLHKVLIDKADEGELDAAADSAFALYKSAYAKR